jgi:hypothetical protein
MTFPREASQKVTAGRLRLTASFRAAADDALAGGPLEIEFCMAPEKGRAYVLSGTERFTLRPDSYAFHAVLEEGGIGLDDPASPDAIGWGGPATMLAFSVQAPFRQTLIVNEFLRLERIRHAMKMDERREIALRCQRALAVATTPDVSRLATAQLALWIGVCIRRDDLALVALADDLQRTVGDDSSELDSPSRRRAIDRLATLDPEIARPRLAALAGHPDPWITARIAHAAVR